MLFDEEMLCSATVNGRGHLMEIMSGHFGEDVF